MLSKLLSYISTTRQKIVEVIFTSSKSHMGGQYQFLMDYLTFLVHYFLLASCVSVMVAIFTVTCKINLFSLYPVFLTIGVFLFIAEGLIVARNKILINFFSPIMQSSQKRKLRNLHATLQITSSAFLFLGLVSILTHKVEIGKSLFPMTTHSLVGTVALAAVVTLVWAGRIKMATMEISNTKVMKWHGDLGLLVFDLLVLSSLLGILSFFGSVETPSGKSPPWLVPVAFILTSWLLVYTQVYNREIIPDADEGGLSADVVRLVTGDGTAIECSHDV